MNPMDMMKAAGMWKEFQDRHPKFPLFLKAAMEPGVFGEGTVLELSVTTPEGRKMETNVKLAKEDMELFEQIPQFKK